MYGLPSQAVTTLRRVAKRGRREKSMLARGCWFSEGGEKVIVWTVLLCFNYTETTSCTYI